MTYDDGDEERLDLAQEKWRLSEGSGAVATPRQAPNRDGALPAGQLAPRCQVDGCDADLSMLKDFHHRHRICELHHQVRAGCLRGG